MSVKLFERISTTLEDLFRGNQGFLMRSRLTNWHPLRLKPKSQIDTSRHKVKFAETRFCMFHMALPLCKETTFERADFTLHDHESSINRPRSQLFLMWSLYRYGVLLFR